jgi:O-antigen/teichoic acid export membrane protein
VPNLYYVLKYGKVRFNLMGWIIRPAAATAAMGIVVWAMRMLLPMHRLLTIVEVVVGIAVYVVTALACKAITKEDLRAFRRRK